MPAPRNLRQTKIYHITEIANLASIIGSGGLLSDARVEAVEHQVIGYDHIKQRRLTELPVPCCGGRFVGEFVPFYYCPRSPMLYLVNMGKTGKPRGHQREVVHLCSRVGTALDTGRDWAISDGNAGTRYATFSRDLEYLKELDWDAIDEREHWNNCLHAKQAEFLVRDVFPWAGVKFIGCYNQAAVNRVNAILAASGQDIPVDIRSEWYY